MYDSNHLVGSETTTGCDHNRGKNIILIGTGVFLWLSNTKRSKVDNVNDLQGNFMLFQIEAETTLCSHDDKSAVCLTLSGL